MGYYTEFHFNVELVRELPEEVLTVLKYMTAPHIPEYVEKLNEISLPEHNFFKTNRWQALFVMDSYNFSAVTHTMLQYDTFTKCYYLSVRSNLKNYFKEIELFVDWITPYLTAIEGDFLGFKRYEDSNTPVLIYYPNTFK